MITGLQKALIITVCMYLNAQQQWEYCIVISWEFYLLDNTLQ